MSSFKKLSYGFLIGFLFITISSCRTDDSDGDISMTISPTSVYALPVKATSCVAAAISPPTPDLSAPSLAFNSLVIKWMNTSSTLDVAYVQLLFQSPSLSGGTFSCFLSDEELNAIFNVTATPYPHLAAMTDPANPPTLTSVCGLKCGSIPLLNQSAFSYVNGVMKVVGYSTDTGGNTTPVQIQTPISFQWQALQ